MTDALSAFPPAGWHPDPGGAPMLLRWWNGASWTDHTRPYGEQSAPVTAAVPTPPSGYTPFASTAVAHKKISATPMPLNGRAARLARGREIRRNNGSAYAGLVLGLFGFIINVFGIPSLLAIIFSSIGLARAGRLRDVGVALTGRGNSIAGLVLGIVGLLWFVGIFAAFVARALA